MLSMEAHMGTSFKVFECKGCKSIYISNDELNEHIISCEKYQTEVSGHQPHLRVEHPLPSEGRNYFLL